MIDVIDHRVVGLNKSWRRSVAIVVIAFAVFARAPIEAHRVFGAPSFNAMLDAYTHGDRHIVANTLKSFEDFKAFAPSLHDGLDAVKSATNAKPMRWDRVKSAFLLEIAAAAHLYAPARMTDVISVGRQYLIARFPPIGGDAADDAFERDWHQLALALLQQRVMADTEIIYVDTLERRYETGADARKINSTLPPRFALASAIALEQRCWASSSHVTSLTTSLPSTHPPAIDLAKPDDLGRAAARPDTRDARRDAMLKDAIKHFDDVAKIPEVATEANIRSAALRVELGDNDGAIGALDRVGADADHVQQYWAALLRARALDSMDRLPEAERAYRAASAIWPDAQAPSVGLALTLFKMNRRREAVDAAAAVRALNADAVDPWWAFIAADGRFIDRWLNQMREDLK